MRKFLILLTAISALGLSACAEFHSRTEVGALNEARAVGSPFTQTLANEYRVMGNDLENDWDHPDSLHFARKGLAAAEGRTVLPEPVSDWNLTPPLIEELSNARADLLNALDNGAREMAAQEAAIAQARFDCWIEQEEKSWPGNGPALNRNCKAEFMQAMSALDRFKQPVPMPESMAPVEALPGATGSMTNEEAKYLVFFDFDKSVVKPEGQEVIDSVVRQTQGRQLNGIRVVGHADTSGPEGYNEALSMRRAKAVQKALASRGLTVDMIRIEGRGETELMVATPDGVREPANRRAEITFE
ncbi:MAG: OmpA family protein [Alphaproteobacteria bacterium]|nr:OmpA family protein [Alphaproteobacteria bacterium]